MSTKIGLNLGFLTFDYEIKSTEQEILTKLFRRFASYRVFTNPYDSEYAGECVEAVKRLREEISNVIQELPMESGVANNLIALQSICSNFLTQIKDISEKLHYDVELNRENINAGVQLMQDQIELVKHYDRIGGPDLMTNTRINLFQIKPIGYQMIFTDSLGKFRGTFGTILYMIAGKNSIPISEELKGLLPSADSYTTINSR
jgi:hypothetical protein